MCFKILTQENKYHLMANSSLQEQTKAWECPE